MDEKRIIKVSVKEAIGIAPTVHTYDCPDHVRRIEDAWDLVKGNFGSNAVIVEIALGYERAL